MAKRKPEETPAEGVPVMVEAPSEATPAPVLAAPPPPAPKAPSPPPAPKPRRYVVKATKVFSLYGAVTTLNAGEVIEEAGYGKDGIDRIVSAGVVLDEVA